MLQLSLLIVISAFFFLAGSFPVYYAEKVCVAEVFTAKKCVETVTLFPWDIGMDSDIAAVAQLPHYQRQVAGDDAALPPHQPARPVLLGRLVEQGLLGNYSAVVHLRLQNVARVGSPTAP